MRLRCVLPLLVSAGLLVAPQVTGQMRGPNELASFGSIRFSADTVAVPELGGGGRVEISYSVAYDELLFLRHDDGYRARYEFSAILYDDGGRQAAGDTWLRRVDVVDYEDTNDKLKHHRQIFTLEAPPGKYRIRLILRSLDTSAHGMIERQLEVPEVAAGMVALGTLVFEKLDDRPGHSDGDFAPNPERVYGEMSPTVRLRIPVYGDPGARYALEVHIETIDRTAHKAFTDTVLQEEWHTEHYREFSVLDLEVGSYYARVVVYPLGEDESSTGKARFEVLTSPRSWGPDFEKMIVQIGYVASMDEVDELVRAPEDVRAEAWDEFWQRHDPDPATEENEFRTEFMRRLGYANTHFGSTLVEGWQTDMGRIYIQYGEPDDVESQPIGRMLYAWETWCYYSDHMKFVFVDKQGFGEFRLVETSRP